MAQGPFTVEGKDEDMVVRGCGPNPDFLMEAGGWFTHRDVVAFRVVALAGCLEVWRSYNPSHVEEVSHHTETASKWLADHMPSLTNLNLWYVACGRVQYAGNKLVHLCDRKCVVQGFFLEGLYGRKEADDGEREEGCSQE